MIRRTALSPTTWMVLLVLALLWAVVLDGAPWNSCGVSPGDTCTTDAECACMHPGTNGDPQ